MRYQLLRYHTRECLSIVFYQNTGKRGLIHLVRNKNNREKFKRNEMSKANRISLRPTGAISLLRSKNITLTQSAYHFQFDMASVSTKAVLVRKRRRTFGAHKRKAPSGRELPTESGEGERVTIEFVQIQGCAGSFRHGFAVPPSSRRKAILLPDSTPKRCNTLYLAEQGDISGR